MKTQALMIGVALGLTGCSSDTEISPSERALEQYPALIAQAKADSLYSLTEVTLEHGWISMDDAEVSVLDDFPWLTPPGWIHQVDAEDPLSELTMTWDSHPAWPPFRGKKTPNRPGSIAIVRVAAEIDGRSVEYHAFVAGDPQDATSIKLADPVLGFAALSRGPVVDVAQYASGGEGGGDGTYRAEPSPESVECSTTKQSALKKKYSPTVSFNCSCWAWVDSMQARRYSKVQTEISCDGPRADGVCPMTSGAVIESESGWEHRRCYDPNDPSTCWDWVERPNEDRLTLECDWNTCFDDKMTLDAETQDGEAEIRLESDDTPIGYAGTVGTHGKIEVFGDDWSAAPGTRNAAPALVAVLWGLRISTAGLGLLWAGSRFSHWLYSDTSEVKAHVKVQEAIVVAAQQCATQPVPCENTELTGAQKMAIGCPPPPPPQGGGDCIPDPQCTGPLCVVCVE